MKCSHGLPYEVKCSECFREAMERVSNGKSAPKVEQFDDELSSVWDRMWVGCYNKDLDHEFKL